MVVISPLRFHGRPLRGLGARNRSDRIRFVARQAGFEQTLEHLAGFAPAVLLAERLHQRAFEMGAARRRCPRHQIERPALHASRGEAGDVFPRLIGELGVALLGGGRAYIPASLSMEMALASGSVG
jgi:hypothetical protein